MSTEPTTVDRIESAANVELVVGDTTVPVSQLDVDKEVSVNQVRHNSIKANGYSITSIEYSGTAAFKGYRISGPDGRAHLEDLIFDDEGIPVPVEIVITHELGGDTETYQDVLFTSDGYQMRSDEESEKQFNWVAMRKESEN